jgi:hypothetical protein
VTNVSKWFITRGLHDQSDNLSVDPDDLLDELRYDARLT